MLNWPERLEVGLFQKSRAMGPPWGPVLRFLRYPAAITRDWLTGEINIWAMSLAYTTLLSLVPLLVFSLSILKGLGARGDLRYILHEFFRPMGGAAMYSARSASRFSFTPSSPRFRKWRRASISYGGWNARAALRAASPNTFPS